MLTTQEEVTQRRRDAHAAAEATANAALLVLTAGAAKSCSLQVTESSVPTGQRDVVLRFDRPGDAEAFVAALKKALG